jgi:hypothetical protein
MTLTCEGFPGFLLYSILYELVYYQPGRHYCDLRVSDLQIE